MSEKALVKNEKGKSSFITLGNTFDEDSHHITLIHLWLRLQTISWYHKIPV